MPDLGSITLPDNTTYNFKDSVARGKTVKYLDIGIDVNDWDPSGTTVLFPSQEWYPSIKQYLASGLLVIIRLSMYWEVPHDPSSTDTFWFFPQTDDVYNDTALKFSTLEFWGGRYYLEIYEGDQGEVTVYWQERNYVPPAYSAGQFLTSNGSGGCYWTSLPTYNGSTRKIIKHSLTDSNVGLYSLTLDGTYGENVTTKEDKAFSGDTVTFAFDQGLANYINVVGDSGVDVELTQIDAFSTGGIRGGGDIPEPPAPGATYVVVEFTMPDENVTFEVVWSK